MVGKVSLGLLVMRRENVRWDACQLVGNFQFLVHGLLLRYRECLICLEGIQINHVGRLI